MKNTPRQKTGNKKYIVAIVALAFLIPAYALANSGHGMWNNATNDTGMWFPFMGRGQIWQDIQSDPALKTEMSNFVKDLSQKEIGLASSAIQDANNALSNSTGNQTAAQKLLDNANKHLSSAQQSFTDGKYAEAVAQSLAARKEAQITVDMIEGKTHHSGKMRVMHGFDRGHERR